MKRDNVVSYTSQHGPRWAVFTRWGEVLGWTVAGTEQQAWERFADRLPTRWQQLRDMAIECGYSARRLGDPGWSNAKRAPQHPPVVMLLRSQRA